MQTAMETPSPEEIGRVLKFFTALAGAPKQRETSSTALLQSKIEDSPDLSRAEFCAAEKISKATYYKLLREGLAPKETRVPGTRINRITQQARLDWRTAMAAHERSDAAKLEDERRRELASRAGKLAAASPLHVSKQKRAENKAVKSPRKAKRG